MSYPKKHFTRWFTTEDLRAINLDLVSDIRVLVGPTPGPRYIVCTKRGDGIDHPMCSISESDAARLYDLLL